MKEQKNIDRLFQEKFKDFEATPDSSVWSNLEKKLKKENERKPFIIPLWYKIAGAAALLVLLFWVEQPLIDGGDTDSNVVNTNKNPEEPANALENSSIISNKEQKENSSEGVISELKTTGETENDTKSTSKSIETLKNNNAVTTVAGNKDTSNASAKENEPSKTSNSTNLQKPQQSQKDFAPAVVESNKEQDTQKLKGVEEKDAVSIAEAISKDGSNDSTKNNSKIASEASENTAISSSETKNTKSLLEEANKVSEELYEESLLREVAPNAKKWEVQPHAAPIYYNGLGGGSAIDPNFSDNSTSTEVSLAYGVNFSYAINERFKIRTGVGKVTHNFNTNEISFGATATPVSLRNVSQEKINGLFVDVVDTDLAERRQQQRGNDLLGSDAAQFFGGSINQTLGYIEVPVELEYALLDTKFGVSLIGGASTLFLDENVIAVETRGNVNDIGKASNVNSVSFSTNIGLGFNYKITKSLQVNLEPTFKYQINTFSDSNDFNPYYLGLYSGFSFKF